MVATEVDLKPDAEAERVQFVFKHIRGVLSSGKVKGRTKRISERFLSHLLLLPS